MGGDVVFEECRVEFVGENYFSASVSDSWGAVDTFVESRCEVNYEREELSTSAGCSAASVSAEISFTATTKLAFSVRGLRVVLSMYLRM